MSQLIKKGIIAVVVIGALAGVGSVVARNGKGKKDEVTYETGKVAQGDVRSSVSATGVIQPWKVVDVKSNVAGRVDRLYVDLGDHVRVGQKIAEIDPTDTRTAVEQAQADLQSSTAKKGQAEANWQWQLQDTEARIAAARKAIESSKAKLAQAKASMKAQPKLTVASISQAQASLASARKAVSQAQQSKSQLEQQLSTLQEVTIPLNVETVQSNLSQAKANLQTADAELRRQRELLGLGYVAKSDVEAAFAKRATMESSVRALDQRKQTLERENQLSIQELKARIDQAQSSIEEAQAKVNQAEAGVSLAKENGVQDEVSAQVYAAAAAGVKQAEADLRVAEANREQIIAKKKDIISAEAQIVRGQSAVSQAKTNLGYTHIMAPRSGVVIVKNVEEGTVVPSSRASIGSTNALLQIGDTSRLWIVCNVDETDIGQVTQGQKVTIKVDAYPSMLIEGKVIRIDPQAKIEQNVTLIPVTVEIDQPDPRFKPGMNASCEFIVDEVTNVLTVPNEALKESEGVYKVQKMVNGKPQEVEVEVGLAGPDTTEIRSGLSLNDEVVTRTVEPKKAEVNNPFGSPFGGPPRGAGGGRGGAGGAGGGRGGR
jgi:HlyD family secretion protein